MKRKKYKLNKAKFKNFLWSVFGTLLVGGMFSAMLILLLIAPTEARF